MEQQRKNNKKKDKTEELTKNKLTKSIKQGLPIAMIEVFTENGEQIDSDFYFNPHPSTWEKYDDIFTIPFNELDKVKDYTTLTKPNQKDNQIFGKIRCRAYSNKLEREINKVFNFFVGSFTNLYGIGNGMQQVRKPNRKISFLEDALDNQEDSDDPELGGFILVRGKEVF